MMMCISGVSDFEAQLTASVGRFERERTAEDVELGERSRGWRKARAIDDAGMWAWTGSPIEPSRPYSHGRRFIPEWLAAERERCMPREMLWRSSTPLTIGYVFDDDYTVAVRWK